MSDIAGVSATRLGLGDFRYVNSSLESKKFTGIVAAITFRLLGGFAMRDYLDYLDSPEWWAQRKAALTRAWYQCEQCGARVGLEVHHRTYRSLGVECADDLEVLCATCHRTAHAARNRLLRQREMYGQLRLFDRWLDGWPRPIRAAAA
jgi:hypothetical protein